MSITKARADDLNLFDGIVVLEKDVLAVTYVVVAEHVLFGEIEPQIGDLQMFGEQIRI